jgi:hypothetical protein
LYRLVDDHGLSFAKKQKWPSLRESKRIVCRKSDTAECLLDIIRKRILFRVYILNVIERVSPYL